MRYIRCFGDHISKIRKAATHSPRAEIRSERVPKRSAPVIDEPMLYWPHYFLVRFRCWSSKKRSHSDNTSFIMFSWNFMFTHEIHFHCPRNHRKNKQKKVVLVCLSAPWHVVWNYHERNSFVILVLDNP